MKWLETTASSCRYGGMADDFVDMGESYKEWKNGSKGFS